MGLRRTQLSSIAPGFAACLAIASASLGMQVLEEAVFGRPYLQSIVIAILIGMAVRTAWTPPSRLAAGIAFAAKPLLEFAVMLLGATISWQLVWSVGPALLVGIVAIVTVALAFGYAVGRALGLSRRVAILIASGNSICGNSAIAAVAPAIGASAAEVVASITFTAVLGVVVVLLLPILAPLARLDEVQYGVLAGLTVYAVPQVLAATVPIGGASVQVGTFVKLVRVLMLGPLVVGLSVLNARRGATTERKAPLSLAKAVPLFILGFLVLMALRSAGLVPDAASRPVALLSEGLTIVAMAALGLGVDARVVARSGGRVTLAVTLSLLLLGGMSLLLVLSGFVSGHHPGGALTPP